MTNRHKSALIVIAHPDDECMFFSPTITHLARGGAASVHVLCLSTGGYYGQQSLRTGELFLSCEKLLNPGNTPADAAWRRRHIKIIDDARLPDSPTVDWPATAILQHIDCAIREFSTDLLVSFDEHGVSGHPNHCAIGRAIARAAQDGFVRRQPITVLQLITHNLLYKYSAPVYLACSAVTQLFKRIAQSLPHASPQSHTHTAPAAMSSRPTTHPQSSKSRPSSPPIIITVDSLSEHSAAAWRDGFAAMWQHESQLVWFRYLYVCTSIYMWRNSLAQLCSAARESS